MSTTVQIVLYFAGMFTLLAVSIWAGMFGVPLVTALILASKFRAENDYKKPSRGMSDLEAKRLATKIINNRSWSTVSAATASNPEVDALPHLTRDFLRTFNSLDIRTEDSRMVFSRDLMRTIRSTKLIKVGTYLQEDQSSAQIESTTWDVCVSPPRDVAFCVETGNPNRPPKVAFRFKTVYHMLVAIYPELSNDGHELPASHQPRR